MRAVPLKRACFEASLGWGCVNSNPFAGPAQEPRSYLKPEAPAEKASVDRAGNEQGGPAGVEPGGSSVLIGQERRQGG